MKTFIVVLGVLLSVTGETAQAETLTPSQTSYLAGIEQLDRGELQSASELFYQAITQSATPQEAPGEYLPYIHLSVTTFKMGHTREARDALIRSQVFGVAAKTETGKQLLDSYAAEIMSAPLDDSEFAPPAPAVAEVVQAEPVQVDASPARTEADDSVNVVYHSDDGTELTSDQVIRRCISSSQRPENNKLPWFFHYQCGIELMKAGDAQRAIDSFEIGATALEDPRRGKRMYGMWFIDYLPYYQMALAHSQLGEWQNAYNALKISENFGEFTPADSDYENFSELDQLIRNHLTDSDS
jgi:hypothetical protein